MINVSHKSWFKRYVEYPFTGLLGVGIFKLFSKFSFKTNSDIGGFLLRTLGPLRKEHKLAINNIKKSFPNLSEEEVEKIVHKMWDNVGRTFFEYTKLDYIVNSGKDFVKINNSYLLDEIKENGKPVIFISAHFGNWEVMRYLLVHILKMSCAFIFRPPNNPYLADIFMNREVSKNDDGIEFPAIEKGLNGFKKLMKYMKQDYSLFALIDQKLSEGIKVNFLNRKVFAVPSTAKLAIKLDREVYMTMMRRANKTNFEIDLIKLPKPTITGNEEQDVLNYTQIMNDYLAEEIKKYPEQWFWVHNRFKNT
ncbi:MAG: lipid A biosynthesis lauroyl acyltransferase [Alphaproteobacteria bacterium ADurb.Bin438]|nr:MAG: lipid A biosynthesis lauroyl acyltransferase [Alphaproteobacteria bacterium ADurb.Bin438]